MTKGELRSELISFFIVAVVFLIGIAIIFRVFCKKFKINDKNIELYGLLLNLDTASLFSMASITINYLFLVWCMISFRGMNIIYIAITMLLVIISDAVLDNFKGMPLSLGMSAVNIIAIHVIYLIYKYVTEEYFSYLLLVVLGLVILFVFLYLTYNLFRGINNIVVKNKYLRAKNYKL